MIFICIFGTPLIYKLPFLFLLNAVLIIITTNVKTTDFELGYRYLYDNPYSRIIKTSSFRSSLND